MAASWFDGSSASDGQTKPRLRLKISRAVLDKKSGEITGTVKRKHRLVKSSAVFEFTSQQPKDLFTSTAQLETAFLKDSSHALPVSEDNKTVSEKDFARVRGPKGNLAVFPEAHRPSSLDTHLDSARLDNVHCKPAVTSDGRSFISEGGNAKPRRGLRTRLSNLRSRLTESHARHIDRPQAMGQASVRLYQVPTAFNPIFNSIETSGDIAVASVRDELEASQSAQSHRLRRKLSQWMKGARKVVSAACVRKRRAATGLAARSES